MRPLSAEFADRVFSLSSGLGCTSVSTSWWSKSGPFLILSAALLVCACSNDIFARSKYEPEHELDAAIKKVGYDIKDVKMIIIVSGVPLPAGVEGRLTRSHPTAGPPPPRSRWWIGQVHRHRHPDLGAQGGATLWLLQYRHRCRFWRLSAPLHEDGL